MSNLKKTSGDYSHAILKGALSEIPLLGGAASEVFNLIITPPLEKRREKWFLSILERLQKLEKKVEHLTAESLSNDARFVTSFLTATQVALRTHNDDKLDILENFVVNAAIDRTVEEEIEQVLLNLIDTFSIWHIRVLELLTAPQDWFDKHKVETPNISAGPIRYLIFEAFPGLKGKESFINLIADDLNAKGLISVKDFGGIVSRQGLFAKHTTQLGDTFLTLIDEKFI